MKRIDANSRAIRELLHGVKFNIGSFEHDLAKLRQQEQRLMHDRLIDRVPVDEST